MRVLLAIIVALFTVVYGLQAEPTASQREAFLHTFMQAISKNDARILDSLIYTHRMTPDLVQAHKESMDHLVEMLNANENHLAYEWEEPPLGGKKAFEETIQGVHYFINSEPAIVLRCLFRGSKTNHRLVLCVESGKLMIAGTLREPVP
jgi:hypothetical protein